MTRIIRTHQVNGLNEALEIAVTDAPGQGGACHEYVVRNGIGETLCKISFQNGPILEHGVNGISQEVLLAIVADRLNSFQRGIFACRENALALTKVQEAMHWLFHRTLDRVQRGVEGTNTP